MRRNTAATAERRALADEHGGMLPYTGYDPDPDLLGGDEAVAWYLERIVPQSYATFEDPITADLPDVAKTYVFCTANVPTVFATYAAAARAAADWRYVELASTTHGDVQPSGRPGRDHPRRVTATTDRSPPGPRLRASPRRLCNAG